jgi:hypothetical protein
VSVDQRDVIDIISRDKNGDVVLTISDHLNWDNTKEHLSILEDKINTYLIFLDSGEIYKNYPRIEGHKVQIQIMFHYQPTAEACLFLAKVRPIVEGSGYGFRFEQFSATPFTI